MPAGRNQVDYSDIRYDAITMKIDNSTITFDPTQANGVPAAIAGKAVKLSADDTVALTTDGSEVFGKLLKVEPDLFATIQRWGFVTLPSTGTITRGAKIVGTTVNGNIRAVNTAVAAELGVARGEIINVADAANVVVDLG